MDDGGLKARSHSAGPNVGRCPPQQLPAKRVVSDSPTNSPRFAGSHDKGDSADGKDTGAVHDSHKPSLLTVSLQHGGLAQNADNYAMLQGRRQRAFALSSQPNGTPAVPSSVKTVLSSASSYSSGLGQEGARVMRKNDSLPVSSSQPNRLMRVDSCILRAKWEIDFSELALEERIGSGNFGVVWRVRLVSTFSSVGVN